MQEQITPVHIMKEIDRLFGKLKEGGFTAVDLSVVRQTRIIENQLVIKWTMQTDKGVKVAEYTHIDPRPIEEIKAQATEQKQALESKVADSVAELDEIIAVEG